MAGNRINVVLSLDTSAFTRAMNRATRDMQRFGSKLEGIGRDLTTRLTLPIVGVGAAAVQAFAKFEGLSKGLEAIATAADPASAQMERLRKLALNPGISLEQAVAGSIRLQAVGQSAADAERTMLQFSKAVALAGGNAEDLDVVTRQLSQIQSKGRILSEDFLVIAERVPAIGLAMQTAFGTKSIEAVRATGISASEFVKRLTEGIASTREFQNVTGGLSNAFDNFKQSITAALVQLGDTINKSINLQGVMDRLSAGVQSVVDRFRALSPETQKLIVLVAGIAAAIGPVLIGLGSMVKLFGLATGGVTALLNPVNLAVVAIGLFAVAVVKAYQESEEFRNQVNRLWQEVKIMGAQFAATAREVFAFVNDLTGGISIMQVFIREITNLTEAVADFFSGLRSITTGAGIRKVLAGALDASSLGQFARFFGVDIGDKIKKGIEEPFRKSPIVIGDRSVDINAPKISTGIPSTGAPSRPTSPGTPSGTGGIQQLKKLQELAVLNGSAFGALANQVDFSNFKLLESKTAVDRVGDSFDIARENAAKWSEALASGLIPLNAELAEQLDAANEKFAQQQERFQAVAGFVSQNLQEAFSGFFDTILSGGQNAFKAFGDILKKIVAQLLKAAATALVLTAVFSIFSGGAGAAKGLLGLGSGGGSLFGGLFKGILGFAEGGIVTKPTLGMIGETGKREAVIPLDRLPGLVSNLQGGNGYIAQTRLSGDDLLILIEKAQRKRGR